MLKYDDGSNSIYDVAKETLFDQNGQIEFHQPQGGGFGGSVSEPAYNNELPMPTLQDELGVINPEFTTPILSQNMLISEPQPQPTTNTNTVYETINSLNANNNDVLGAETSILNTGLDLSVTSWKNYLPIILAVIGIALTVYQLTKSNKKY